ncbi:MAG: hypothetical protein R3B13_09110 [Polyangiaceae bacterium]
MTELVPLMHEDPDAFERELLSSARIDIPGSDGKAKLLAALGVGTAAVAAAQGALAATATSEVAAGATAAGAGSAASGATGAAVASTAVGKVATLSLVKWLGVGALAGTVLSTGTVMVMPGRVPTPHTVAAVARPVETAPAAGQVAAPKSTAPTAAVDEADVVVPQPPSSVHAAAAPASELELMDDARSAVLAGDAAKALAALDARERAHGQGMLGPEAEVLRIEALMAAGRRGEAASRAQRFLLQHAQSPHARRVRTLLSRLQGGEQKASASAPTPAAVPARASQGAFRAPSPAQPSQVVDPSPAAPPSTASFPTP